MCIRDRWWTHSASSAIVFAEAIAELDDNDVEVKMVMRGNVVYNSWNRIPFYSRTSVPNGNGPGGDYGTYAQNTVIDGQGLYVTRSDPSYAGIFLFENNIVFFHLLEKYIENVLSLYIDRFES